MHWWRLHSSQRFALLLMFHVLAERLFILLQSLQLSDGFRILIPFLSALLKHIKVWMIDQNVLFDIHLPCVLL